MNKHHEERHTRKAALVAKYAGKSGFKGKMIAHCIECGFDPADDGSWRQQIESCPVDCCSLYSIRPVSMPSKEVVNGAD